MTARDTLPDLDRMREALLPLRTALRAEALREADRLRLTAEEEAGHVLEQARAEVDALLDAARDQGRRDAQAAGEVARAAARRRGRELVLRAQREVYDDLVRQVRCAAAELAGDRWAERVATLARRRLGPHARVEVGRSRVTAEEDGRRTTWTLEALAAAAVEDLGERVEELWEP